MSFYPLLAVVSAVKSTGHSRTWDSEEKLLPGDRSALAKDERSRLRVWTGKRRRNTTEDQWPAIIGAGVKQEESKKEPISLGSKITADGDCSHKIKRCLLLGWKAVTNLACVWAKLLQLYPNLCDPMDCSPPDSSIHGKNTGEGRHAFLQGIFPIQASNSHLIISVALAVRFFITSANWEAPWQT